MAKPVAVVHDNLPVIEVRDALTLDQLLADVTLKTAIVYRLGPQVAAIDPDKMDLLMKRLAKLGHLPKVVES